MVSTQEKIVVLDFGGQYSRLIARRVRELGVYSEVVPCDIGREQLQSLNPTGLILSGGPAGVCEDNAPHMDEGILKEGWPVLGICYGFQLMAHILPGGQVEAGSSGEYGRAELTIRQEDPLFSGLTGGLEVWMSHGDTVERLPGGFQVLASTQDCRIAAAGDPGHRLFGVQFHPEVDHTPQGRAILGNFLFEICGCKGDWSLESFIENEIETIRNEIGGQQAICGLSGGVDSAVSATLVHRAIGDHLTCIFVDHGLLREGEAEQVRKTFSEQFSIPLIYVDARDRFLDRLSGVTDPERKRKIIGEEFIRVFEEQAEGIGNARFLVQGTLYSDVIESGVGRADTIKSHHNVGGLPERMDLDLIEPLRYLFKDEGRKVGEILGLPPGIVWRQPFPGPGLGIRIIGEITPEKLAVVRRADSIVREEIANAGLDREIWQFFAVLPSFRSVGVQGDGRSYAYTVAIRAVNSRDAMTADWARLPHKLLERMSVRIVNETEGVNRVVYDISSKPPATIEWE